MPHQGLVFFMQLTYVVVGSAFLVAAGAVVTWLSLAVLRRRGASWTLCGQELIWTLVPALVFMGLTVLGEIPRGWVKFAVGPRAAETQIRAVR